MATTPDPRDTGPLFSEPAAPVPLTADERATLQTAFAALVRSGRPLFAPPAPPAPGAASRPLDPADPGLETRVRAILDRSPSEGEEGGPVA